MGQPQRPFAQQPQASEQDPWSSWGTHSPQRPPWKINRKNTDALTPFNGVLEHYRDWVARIRDHVSEDWAAWREILDHSAQAPEELRPEQLKRMTIYGVNAWDLASDLWSFLLKQIGPTLYARRMKFGVDIEGNGQDLWRKLHSDVSGSDKLLQIAGRTTLQDFA